MGTATRNTNVVDLNISVLVIERDILQFRRKRNELLAQSRIEMIIQKLTLQQNHIHNGPHLFRI